MWRRWKRKRIEARLRTWICVTAQSIRMVEEFNEDDSRPPMDCEWHRVLLWRLKRALALIEAGACIRRNEYYRAAMAQLGERAEDMP